MENNVKKIFYILIITLTSSVYSMQQQQSKADYWNQKRNKRGNTHMHDLVEQMHAAENHLDLFITTYKNAIKEGGNPDIPNNNNDTAAQLLKDCFVYKFFEAVDQNNRTQINQLILSAPELCLESQHPIQGTTPFGYAIRRKHLYAQAMISYYLHHGIFPETYTLIEKIADYL